MIKIESLGSFWFVDTHRRTYTRTPKTERPRPNPTHTNVGTALEDLVTFPYTKIEFIDLEEDNLWSAVSKASNNYKIVAVLRFHTLSLPRKTPLGVGPWVHAL